MSKTAKQAPVETPGQIVSRLRQAKGMTQAALAEASGVGQAYISRLERGERDPTWTALRRLFAALGASLALLDPPAE